LGGLMSSSDRADDSLPGDSALMVDRDAAARFGLAGDDIMKYTLFGGMLKWRGRKPLSIDRTGLNVVYKVYQML
jgi:hypothetical protein